MLLLRHPPGEAAARIVDGTRRNCIAAGVPERFDESLTRHWVAAISDALQATDARTFDDLLERRPELARSDLIAR